ncbi:7-carboxy-7-deazaguanine synthase QueE [Flexithrix dorotheae]|uniref:7-carboxy-7-deazaguanine synthase QueE n=1 Tax=Flexithrix dorotheae TaxID=70993 RepID=UPI00038103F8|nr:7-carboxy-7-deazaguanine synthase QueE [Flexithrix dorotheae]
MEKELIKTERLPVMEAFYTIQGEGFFTGHPAYFIRLGGCDVGCVWCDVKDSWDADAHPKMDVSTIVKEALEYPARKIVLTGGEPLMYNLDELTSALKNEGFQINIETSGAYPLSGKLDWITFSPKKFKAPLTEFYEAAHELKVIIFNKSDFAWAESFAEKMNPDCKLYLQTEWGKQDKMMPQIVEYVKANPKWQISIQTHKFINVP